MDVRFFWLDYNQKAGWKEWLSKFPFAKKDIYFDPDYLRLYAEDNESVNCYIYVKNDDIYLYPFIKRAVPWVAGYFDISTPYGYGGPVFTNQDNGFVSEAYRCFCREAAKRKIAAELIKFHPLLSNHLPLVNIFNGSIRQMRSTVYVDLDIDEDQRWKNIYTYANRKNINKARRNNIEVRFGQDGESWEAFESLYEETMTVNKAAQFYRFSKGHFEDIRNRLDESYILVSCVIKAKIISVLLVLLGEAYAHCHLIGTDRRFLNTGINNLLHHELILWCKNKGYQKLHIGGGRSDSKDDSLLRFKENFSDKTSPFYVGESILNRPIYEELCEHWDLENSNQNPPDRLLRYRIKVSEL